MIINDNICNTISNNDSICNKISTVSRYEYTPISSSNFCGESVSDLISKEVKKIVDETNNTEDLNGINIVMKNAFCLDVKNISVQSDGTTVVRWCDGDVTFVRCSKDDKNDLYAAFCAALAKKVYGSTSQVRKIVSEYNVENINKKTAEKKRKATEERMKREKINHDRKIRSMAKRMRLEEEARNYYMSRK